MIDAPVQSEFPDAPPPAKRKPGRPRKSSGSAGPPDSSAPSVQGCIVAADLGNGTTIIARQRPDGVIECIPDKDGLHCTPTAIAFENGDPGRVLYGRPALNYRRVHPEFVCIAAKRTRGQENVPVLVDAGSRTWNSGELESLFLQRIIQDAETAIGEKITGLLATVPANFSDAQRRSTLERVKDAGCAPIGVVNEPTAGLLHYAYGRKGRFAIVDLGAGTVDITIAAVEAGNRFTILATAGRDDLGGIEYTAQIIGLCMEYAAKAGTVLNPEEDLRDLILLETACEAAKCDLSSQAGTYISFRVRERLFDIELTRDGFETLTRPLTKSIIAAAMEALNQAGLNAQQLDGVVLCGGAIRMPVVQSALAEVFGADKLLRDVDVDRAVALGAVRAIGLKIQESVAAGEFAIEGVSPGYHLNGQVTMQEVCGQALGVRAVNSRTGEAVLVPIVSQGASLPAAASRCFGLVHDEGDEVNTKISVLEGAAYAPAAEAALLAEFPLDDLPPGPASERIEISFAVDTNGLVSVHARDTQSGKEIQGEVHVGASLNQAALD